METGGLWVPFGTAKRLCVDLSGGGRGGVPERDCCLLEVEGERGSARGRAWWCERGFKFSKRASMRVGGLDLSQMRSFQLPQLRIFSDLGMSEKLHYPLKGFSTPPKINIALKPLLTGHRPLIGVRIRHPLSHKQFSLDLSQIGLQNDRVFRFSICPNHTSFEKNGVKLVDGY